MSSTEGSKITHHPISWTFMESSVRFNLCRLKRDADADGSVFLVSLRWLEIQRSWTQDIFSKNSKKTP